MQKRIETEHFIIEQLEEGCFRANIKSKLEVSLELAKEFHEKMNEITNRQKHTLVFNGANLIYVHSDAREFLKTAQDEDQTAVAVAFIAKSALARMAGNIFLSINRPAFPMKLFTNLVEAENWAIAQFKEFQAAA